MPSFGISYLSKEALREARRFMDADQAGVRDEIGFLIVHQRYADRFFPGTSVLHTRLRYALFVPWIYNDVRNSRARTAKASDAIARGEHQLTKRLLNSDSGVIGGRVYPNPIDQPPSYVYWTALQAWGLLRERGPFGRWSRSQVERLLSLPAGSTLTDDDGLPVEQQTWPFADCPEPPDEWRSGDDLNFKLTKKERDYMARQLRAVDSPAVPGEPSLLAMLVGKPLDDADNAWDAPILEMARHERDALERAGQAAALAAVGRAIYAAQVETLKQELDKRACSDRHRAALPGIVKQWGSEASALDWKAFENDMRILPPLVSKALRETLDWLHGAADDPMLIEPIYRHAEEKRKNRRARLSRTQDGVDRRDEWSNEEHSSPDALHYRWSNVKRLLSDLEGVR